MSDKTRKAIKKRQDAKVGLQEPVERNKKAEPDKPKESGGAQG